MLVDQGCFKGWPWLLIAFIERCVIVVGIYSGGWRSCSIVECSIGVVDVYMEAWMEKGLNNTLDDEI